MTFDYLLLYIIACALLYTSNKNHPLLFLLAVFVPLAFFMGFRATEVGIDTEAYYDLFEFSKNEPWRFLLSEKQHHGAETGFLCLNKLFSYISEDYYHFQLFLSILYCTGFAIFIYRDTKMPVMGLALFLGFDLYFQAFNISRQMFVIMLSVLGYPLLKSKHYLWASIYIFLLANLHTTAYLLFLYIFVGFLPKFFEKVLPFLVLLFVFFFSQIIELSSFFFEKYQSYYMGRHDHTFSIGFSSIIYILVIVLSLWFYYKKEVTYTEKINALFSVSAVTCIFLGLQMNYMERVGLVFMPYTVLTMIAIGKRIKDNKSRSLYTFCVITVMLLFFYLRIPSNYTTILF